MRKAVLPCEVRFLDRDEGKFVLRANPEGTKCEGRWTPHVFVANIGMHSMFKCQVCGHERVWGTDTIPTEKFLAEEGDDQ